MSVFPLFFFNDTAPSEISTLSLHDALPILSLPCRYYLRRFVTPESGCSCQPCFRSEEHTSELQSRGQLVCRLLLEKKKADVFVGLRNRLFPCGDAPGTDATGGKGGEVETRG